MNRRLVKQLITLGMLLAALQVGSLLHAVSAAGPFDGRWEAQMTGDGKTYTWTFNFKTDRNTLTGTVEDSTQDRAFEIKDGTTKGNNVSFTAFGWWTGTLDGGNLKLVREIDYGKKQYMTAHRLNER